jgi:MFS family permease
LRESSHGRVQAGHAALRLRVWALYNVGFIVVLVFGPNLLTSQGVPIAAAGATVSLVTWTILLSLPLGGYLAQRVNSPDIVMVGCFLALALLASLLPSGSWPLLVCAVLGVLAGPPAGLIMALPGSALQKKNRSAGMGVFYTCYYAAMAGLVPVAGFIRDATQSPASPLYFASAMMVGAVVVLALFRAVQR